MDIFLRNLKRKYCFNFIFTVSSCDNVLNLGLVRVCSFLSVFGEKFHRRSNTSLFNLKKIHYCMSKEVYTNMYIFSQKYLRVVDERTIWENMRIALARTAFRINRMIVLHDRITHVAKCLEILWKSLQQGYKIRPRTKWQMGNS